MNNSVAVRADAQKVVKCCLGLGRVLVQRHRVMHLDARVTDIGSIDLVWAKSTFLAVKLFVHAHELPPSSPAQAPRPVRG